MRKTMRLSDWKYDRVVDQLNRLLARWQCQRVHVFKGTNFLFHRCSRGYFNELRCYGGIDLVSVV